MSAFKVTLATRIEAASLAAAERAADEMAATIGASVEAVRDVSGTRGCARCGGLNDQPPADRASVPVCVACLRALSR